MGDHRLERFRVEYSQLQAALKSSQASEERLIKKCKQLSSEMVERVAMVQSALRLSEGDQATVAALKQEVAQAWKLLEATQGKLAKADELIQDLQHDNAALRRTAAAVRLPRVAAFSVLVPDYDSAIAFFVDCCGFELAEDRNEQRKRWVAVRPPGGSETQIVLARADNDTQRAAMGRQLGGRVGFFLHTDSFSRDYARMKANGVKFREEPRHEKYGVVAVWEDPWGNAWDLLQPA